jgi:putative ferrous iron transport protein C
MLLLELRDYVKKRNRVNLRELALHFQRDPDTLREILTHWLRKGVICRAPQPSGCGSRCGQCHPSVAEIYCWRE